MEADQIVVSFFKLTNNNNLCGNITWRKLQTKWAPLRFRWNLWQLDMVGLSCIWASLLCDLWSAWCFLVLVLVGLGKTEIFSWFSIYIGSNVIILAYFSVNLVCFAYLEFCFRKFPFGLYSCLIFVFGLKFLFSNSYYMFDKRPQQAPLIFIFYFLKNDKAPVWRERVVVIIIMF